MRDDQRPKDHSQEEEEELFDDALDDLFGLDEDDQETRPHSSRQLPQDAGGNTPPPREYVPDSEHHQPVAGHVLGSENAPPPPSYDTSSRTPESTSVQTTIPVDEPKQGRNWRRIACFGCLAAVGIPAFCLGVLVLIGIIWGDSGDATPTVAGVFVDEPTSQITEGLADGAPTIAATTVDEPTPQSTEALADDAPTIVATTVDEPTPQSTDGLAEGTPSPIDSSSSADFPESFRTIMDGREPLVIEVDGEAGFGTLNKPVPLLTFAPLGDGWELQINSVTADANQLVADANMFNDPPAEGRQYVIANVTATNGTGAPNTFDASYRLRAAGIESGNVYTTFGELDRCGVIPEPAEDEDVAPGQLTTGNVCWQVRSEDVDSLILFNENFSDLDGAIWFVVTAAG